MLYEHNIGLPCFVDGCIRKQLSLVDRVLHCKSGKRAISVSCGLCGEVFDGETRKAVHLYLYHDVVDAPFRCKLCNRCFVTAFNVETHVVEIHHQAFSVDAHLVENANALLNDGNLADLADELNCAVE